MNQNQIYETAKSLYQIVRKPLYAGLAALTLYAITPAITYAKDVAPNKNANSQSNDESKKPNAIEKLIIKFVGGTGRGLIGSYTTIENKIKSTPQWRKGKKSWDKYFTEEGRALNEVNTAQKELITEKEQTDRVVKLLQQHGYQVRGYSPSQTTHTGATHQPAHPQQNIWNQFNP